VKETEPDTVNEDVRVSVEEAVAVRVPDRVTDSVTVTRAVLVIENVAEWVAEGVAVAVNEAVAELVAVFVAVGEKVADSVEARVRERVKDSVADLVRDMVLVPVRDRVLDSVRVSLGVVGCVATGGLVPEGPPRIRARVLLHLVVGAQPTAPWAYVLLERSNTIWKLFMTDQPKMVSVDAATPGQYHSWPLTVMGCRYDVIGGSTSEMPSSRLRRSQGRLALIVSTLSLMP